jgi:pheromone shutdown protein TraB
VLGKVSLTVRKPHWRSIALAFVAGFTTPLVPLAPRMAVGTFTSVGAAR